MAIPDSVAPAGEGAVSAGDLCGLPPIAWTETFATGNSLIDRQHRQFIEQVNELTKAAAAGEPPQVILAMLTEMAADARDHFASEEAAFARLGYADAAAHAQEHRRLERRMDAVLASVRTAPDAMAARLAASSMRELLVNHLLYFDLRYKSLALHTAGLRAGT